MARSGVLGRIWAAVAVVVGVWVLPAAPAAAGVGSAAASWTPQISSPDSVVRKLVQCRNTMYAVGAFTQVTQGGTVYDRSNAFSFDATTGAVTSWAPPVNADVESIALTRGCGVAYLGGDFTAVGSVSARNLVALSTATGAVVTRFAHDDTNGEVRTLAMVNGWHQLMVGGSFTIINGTARPYFASLDPVSGAVTDYSRVSFTGHQPGSTRTMVYNSQLSPQGDRMLVEGSFTAANGIRHAQLVELDVAASSMTLDTWSNHDLDYTSCYGVRFYGRAATFSPDQKTIYLAATGGWQGSSPYCDAVTAFTNTANSSVRWINKTGGDSLYAVAAERYHVFIAGHERWADNPAGQNTCVGTCVSRPGMGAISVASGHATSWNPTRDRGHGADDLLLTPAGLWVASDTYFGSKMCARQSLPGICFIPNA